jgi:hypothetical protein
MLLTSLATYAYDFESNGIYYNITSADDKTVEVTTISYNYYSGDVVIPEKVTCLDTEYTVTAIGDITFAFCSSLTSIELPSSLTKIGNYAFYECTSLASIELPSSLTKIGNYAFYKCFKLESIELPESVTSISDAAFANCTSLACIKLPSSVTAISNGAFEICTSLASIELPSSVTSIGAIAFQYCTSLASIELPESVISIDDRAFVGCTSLANIVLPSSLTTIGNYAFGLCESLRTVTSLNSEPSTLGSNVFYSCPIETVYVPTEAVEAYQEADGWNEFNIVGIDTSGVEDAIFGGDAFGEDVIENTTVYTLQGVRVNGVRTMDDVKSLTPGLYIVNGKKVLVK